ncbi:melanopsin-like [Macrosteles quadrilineatus]|uniref:melanopsin-like n=1 Tax=Macrosteles quadrilineatus TaxID=74068 RepID=UPI0023E0C7ED|nr:melanopsin-like [Macrosteles quadrilineatus]
MISLALGVPLTVVTVIGLFLNGYILFVVIFSKEINTANNLLLLHLGLVDSLLCSMFLVFSAPTLLRGWTMPCTVHGFLFTLLHPVALWTVCGLNCDRYYAISAPLHYGALVSPKKVTIGLAATWVLALLLCIPPLFRVAPYSYNTALAVCAPDFTAGDAALWYSAVYTTLTLVLPAALILGCNLKVLMIARYHRHRIASAIFEVTLSAQVTITHQRNPFFLPGGLTSKFRGRSAVSTVLQLLGSFFVLYFPYYGVIVWESSASTFLAGKDIYYRLHPHIITLASTLLTCSPPVNGLLYGIKSKILRKTFQNYWRKQMSKVEINHEIQARTPSACGSRRPSLTPLGILTRPSATHLQRRLSEAFIDPSRSSLSSPKSKMTRISSEISWRPVSTSGLGLAFVGSDVESDNNKKSQIRAQHAASFSTLQVPSDERERLRNEDLIKSFRIAVASTKENEENKSLGVIRPVLRTSVSNTSLFVQRVLGAGNIRFNLGDGNRDGNPSAPQTRRSPRILITRAFSEESEPKTPSSPSTPNRKSELKKHSISATTLICDSKWRKSKNNVAFLDEICNKDLSSPCASSNSSVEDQEEEKLFRPNGILSPDDGNISDGGDSIVWMKDTTNDTSRLNCTTSSGDDSDNAANYDDKHNYRVLRSWPCASNRKVRNVVASGIISDEDSPPPSRNRVLRTSCSFTTLQNTSSDGS